MLFKPKQNYAYIFIDKTEVVKVRNAKFLGVVIDDTISWEHHIQALQFKVAKNVGVLYRAAFKLVTRELYIIYCTLVLLILQCYVIHTHLN